MYALLVVQGPDRGDRHSLPEREPQLIGRSTEAIPLSDDSVSRRHAELTPDEGRWWIRDLESTNGTFLNDEPVVDRVPISPGDLVRCGDTTLRFVHVDETATHGTLRSPDPSRHAIRLLDADGPGAAMERHPLLRLESTDRALMASTVAGLVEADAIGLVPIDEHGVPRGLVEVRTVTGQPPETPLDLPRELVAAILEGSGRRLARQAVVDESTIVLATAIGDAGSLHLMVGSRPIDRPWSSADLERFLEAATILELRLHVADGLASATRLERLAAMGEATAALSHSIKNILQGMRGGADAIQLALDRDRLDLAKRGWSILSRNLDRIMGLSLNLLAYSKERALDIQPTVIEALVSEAAESLAGLAADRRVDLQVDGDPDTPPVPVDPDAIHHVILNLVGNALEAAPEDGRILIRSRYHPDRDEVEVLVEDDGPGIPFDRRNRVFEPFYSTKGQRGTGLGLAVARKLVERHGGTLDVDSSTGLGGALFRMTVPASREEDLDASDTRGPNPIQGGDLGVRFEP